MSSGRADTIDWDAFWAEADGADREGARASTIHARETVRRLLDAWGGTTSFADVGCGPGDVAFAVADHHPDATVVGYDAAASVVEEARGRARDREIGNVRFERATLPAFDPDRTFETVFCYATLGYVAESERAVRALYDAVEPGGRLVCSYPNRLARGHYRSVVADPETALADVPGFDPDRFGERFRLVIEGENLLSYERIHGLLGRWPQSVFSVVERPDVRYAWRHHPLVYVPKPRSDGN